MNESDSPRESNEPELSAQDLELSRRIAATLDRSTGEIDAHTRAQLAARRHEALTRSHTRRVVIGMALAASLVAIVATPWMLQRNAAPMASAIAVNDMAYLSADPQMLADMEMLQALGESDSSADHSSKNHSGTSQ